MWQHAPGEGGRKTQRLLEFKDRKVDPGLLRIGTTFGVADPPVHPSRCNTALYIFAVARPRAGERWRTGSVLREVGGKENRRIQLSQLTLGDVRGYVGLVVLDLERWQRADE